MKILHNTTQILSWASIVATLAMMLVVVADVVLRAAFHTPIRGAFDFVEISLVVVVFLGLPRCFLQDRNITVDLVDSFVPERIRAALKLTAGLLAFGFLLALVWNMIGPARDSLQFADRKPDLPVPIFALWGVIFVGCLASLAALLHLCIRTLLPLGKRVP